MSMSNAFHNFRNGLLGGAAFIALVASVAGGPVAIAIFTSVIALAALIGCALLASRYRLALHDRETLSADVRDLKHTIVQLSDQLGAR